MVPLRQISALVWVRSLDMSANFPWPYHCSRIKLLSMRMRLAPVSKKYSNAAMMLAWIPKDL